ncbi:hypothetical protein C5167_012788, partial [Papaver somniferum]
KFERALKYAPTWSSVEASFALSHVLCRSARRKSSVPGIDASSSVSRAENVTYRDMEWGLELG